MGFDSFLCSMPWFLHWSSLILYIDVVDYTVHGYVIVYTVNPLLVGKHLHCFPLCMSVRKCTSYFCYSYIPERGRATVGDDEPRILCNRQIWSTETRGCRTLETNEVIPTHTEARIIF
jgi:hypothetical protein